MPVRTLVLNSIAGNKLSHPISLKQLKLMKHLAVANKNFINLTPFICFAIAQAVGADVYEDFFLDEKKKDHGLHYRKSIFGWVVTGVLSHVRGYQQSSSCSRTRPCSLLGGREDSSSDADVQWKSSLCGTLQHIDLFCIWRLHHCLLPFKVWSTFFEQFSNSQAEIVRSGAETQWSRWSAAAVSWIQSRNVYMDMYFCTWVSWKKLLRLEECAATYPNTVCSRILRRLSFVSCLIPAASLQMAILSTIGCCIDPAYKTAHSLPPTPTCFVGRCGKDLQVGGFIRVRSWLPSNSVASLRDGRDTRNAYDPWDVRCCQLLLPFNPITSRDW